MIIASLVWRDLWLDVAKMNLANIALMKTAAPLPAPGRLPPEAVAGIVHADAAGPLAARFARTQGMALLWTGQPGQAVTAFERAAALEGAYTSAVTQMWLGDAYQAADDIESATRAWDQAGGARILARKADELRRAGRLAAAAAVFQAAIDLHPEAAAGYAGLGLIAVDRQDWAAAASWLTQALAFNPDLPEAHTGLATVLIHSGHYQEARAHLERAIALKPEAITAYLLMGDTFVRAGDYTTARYWYHQAATRFPTSPEPDIRLALSAIAQAQPQEAFAALDAAGRKDPNSAQRYIVLARAYRLVGGPQSAASAVAALEQAVQLAPNDLWAWLWLGDAYRDAGRCDASQAAYAHAAALDSQNAQVAAHQAVACPLESTTRTQNHEGNDMSPAEMIP